MKKQRKIWFVTQGSTYTVEKGMKFLWAPTMGKDNKKNFYWENLIKVKEGDIIFHYSKGLKGISIAKTDGFKSENEDSNSTWLKDGYRIDVDLTILNPVIRREQLVNNKDELNTYLTPVINKPFNSAGGVNQGYLYEFTKEAGKCIRDIYGKEFGNKLIDDFFDSIILEKINPDMENDVNFDQQDFFNQALASNYFIQPRLSSRFISSLLTKPFVILTGLSGSGKTKLAQAFVMWICADQKQYCIIPVGADWTNREPLLGFPNALKIGEYIKPDNGVLDLIIEATENEKKPYFLILDEMNLSHVERYFADFLSVMESTSKISLHSGMENWNGVPPTLELPKNLFIIGTVNIDETTYMFSPKVLDRASVIEFRVTKEEMGNYLETYSPLNLKNLAGLGKSMAGSFVETATNSIVLDNVADLKNLLIIFFSELKKTGAEFGYRTAFEILRFAAMVNKMEAAWTMNDIIDAAIMQKLLPKVHGSRRKLEPVLKALAAICLSDGQKVDDYLPPKNEVDFTDTAKIKYPISLEKILRMCNNLLSNGFTSYAEA